MAEVSEVETAHHQTGDQNLDLVVMGLGYVGLPLVRQAIRAGLTVAGLDVAVLIVEQLNQGRSHVDDVSDTDVREMREAGFWATTVPALLARAETIVICVPTPLATDNTPDLGAVISATDTVAGHVQRGTVVILESTTYAGTTEQIVRPRLEAAGWEIGVDMHLAYSAERIDPGSTGHDVGAIPRVVGGCTPSCAARAATFYNDLVPLVVIARGTREAEMAKLLENTYRSVNIALVNEMAQHCHAMGIDVWDVIRCASTKTFGFQPFFPGPGVGGHCIPVDPLYLAHQTRTEVGQGFRIVELADTINRQMPTYVAGRIVDALRTRGRSASGARILLLGVTYKADVSDQRNSPAAPLAEHLKALGAELSFHDPFVPKWTVGEDTFACVDDVVDASSRSDITVLLQRHRQYDLDAVADAADLVLDTRGVMPDRPAVHRL